ncbi:hypothetical protein GRK05_004836, partial [Salmonella enterica]|nr:hypothetical protein [Salmonella enterica subsp. enterica serovar Derby]ECJ6558579.1 hypothetical protein [Salmonella enterica subsp. enterica]EDS9030332.1 hypothetical protein [Salmonella enterica]HEC9109524.1 hypothetical protein [Salmonella enterica subsp. enterica serovar Lexington]ECP7642325.1 hypothetical protein [Salmonella enterica subsp. enterica serovar Derby]
MNDDLNFINNIDGKILFEHYQYLTNAILGDDDTKKEFVKYEYYDLDYLRYYLEASIYFLGEARDEANRDVEIKDLNEVVEIINKLSNRAKVALAENIILWFEDIS